MTNDNIFMVCSPAFVNHGFTLHCFLNLYIFRLQTQIPKLYVQEETGLVVLIFHALFQYILVYQNNGSLLNEQ